MKKNKNGPPRRSPNKKKAPKVAGPGGAFGKRSPDKANRHDVQTNDTTFHWKVNHTPPVDDSAPPDSQLHHRTIRSLTGGRRWPVIENFKQRLAEAITTQPALFDVNGSPPVTTQQINYLVKLYHRTGPKKFAQIKNDLGITRKVPDLTRHEASVLIKALQNGAYDRKSHWSPA